MLLDTPRAAEPSGASPVTWWRQRATTNVLLMAGILAVVAYAVGDLLSGVLYDGYSFKDQAISELSAFGSPVRPLMATVIVVHGALEIAFGVGILRVADRRSLRWVGGLLIAAGAIAFPTHTFWAMSSRDLPTGFNDTMHQVLSFVFSMLVFAAIIASAVAYRGWFRQFSLAVLPVLIGFGLAASISIGGIERNDTPWTGGFERINAYSYFVWLVVLAILLMRRRPVPRRWRHRFGQVDLRGR